VKRGVAFASLGSVPKHTVQKGHWKDINNCRRFFCELAASKGFDPFVASNWYQVTHIDVITAGVCSFCVAISIMFTLALLKGQGMLTHRFKNRLRDAIRAAFPELDFDAHWLQGNKKRKENT
jgi:hypothetical protein